MSVRSISMCCSADQQGSPGTRPFYRATMGGVDLIHAHDWLVAFAGIALKHALKTPLLTQFTRLNWGGTEGYSTTQSRVRSVIPSAVLVYESWRVICCSHYMAQEVRQYFGCPADKIDVIPNGIVTSRFDDLEGVDLSKFRARFAAPTEHSCFLLADWSMEKGIQVLIDAVSPGIGTASKYEVCHRGYWWACRMRYAGKRMLGVASRVYFTDSSLTRAKSPAQDRGLCGLPQVCTNLLGSLRFEAMSAKEPVVVAETGGLREVVEHGETGISVYQGNPESLAWGILHTYSILNGPRPVSRTRTVAFARV